MSVFGDGGTGGSGWSVVEVRVRSSAAARVVEALGNAWDLVLFLEAASTAET